MRIVMAKPGLDGHDRGAKVIARALRDGGHEVIYTGLRKRPREIVRIVIDEDADALGLSTLSGAHNSLIPIICEGLRESGLNEVVVFAGGIIPERDRASLYQSGVRAVFGPGTLSVSILGFLESVSARRRDGDPVGVGEDSGWHWQ
ncbi:MAG: cobalamin B12-binding domain-containing protein [Candidatus Thermoplasmatota archaeon]|nr:cobalamin B12-binding domain-containing protein [Candidatus Thermoplasmatota archaeon]